MSSSSSSSTKTFFKLVHITVAARPRRCCSKPRSPGRGDTHTTSTGRLKLAGTRLRRWDWGTAIGRHVCVAQTVCSWRKPSAKPIPTRVPCEFCNFYARSMSNHFPSQHTINQNPAALNPLHSPPASRKHPPTILLTTVPRPPQEARHATHAAPTRCTTPNSQPNLLPTHLEVPQ